MLKVLKGWKRESPTMLRRRSIERNMLEFCLHKDGLAWWWDSLGIQYCEEKVVTREILDAIAKKKGWYLL